MAKILVIDDEKSIRQTLREILSFENYTVDEAKDGVEAYTKLSTSTYDLALCDVKMPGMDGIELLSKSIRENLEVPFIMITAHGNIDLAVEAMKIGAVDFLSKPPDLNRLLISVSQALQIKDLKQETKRLKAKIEPKYQIIGRSAALMQLLEMVDKVSPTDAKVLLEGENGTGKELIAHRIHLSSDRRAFAFVEVNCAAIPSELIESELFGHEKGSFTSAVRQHLGKFEQAHRGTLFLDEIGDMSLTAQAKVLKSIEEHKITRVGGQKDIPVDVRIVAATNKNLKDEISKGNFREDLYHRLAVIRLRVPPLRERSEDIPLLIHHFLKTVSAEYGRNLVTIDQDAVDLLSRKSFTGNVRELKNTIERLCILGQNPISLSDVEKFT